MKEIHSLERIVPDEMDRAIQWSAETLELHMERYQFASAHITGGAILDMACGVGYGAQLLCEAATVESVTAVDIDADCIAYARQRYSDPKINFLQADATKFDSDRKFNAIVSLETIEHIPQADLFLAHLFHLLDRNAVLICSVPVTPSMDANPYHMHDFTEKEFLQLLIRAGFSIEEKMIQVQPFSPFELFNKKAKRAESLRKNLPMYYVRHPSALIKRVVSTMRYGFTNRYLVVCCRKNESSHFSSRTCPPQ